MPLLKNHIDTESHSTGIEGEDETGRRRKTRRSKGRRENRQKAQTDRKTKESRWESGIKIRTAIGFQTGERHQAFPGYHWGRRRTKKERKREREREKKKGGEWGGVCVRKMRRS